jgi:hypothetical protein
LLDENLYVMCWKKDSVFEVIQDEQLVFYVMVVLSMGWNCNLEIG